MTKVPATGRSLRFTLLLTETIVHAYAEAALLKKGSPEWFKALMKCKEGTALGISIVATSAQKTRQAEPEAMAIYMEQVR
jgi:hypothetical protein